MGSSNSVCPYTLSKKCPVKNMFFVVISMKTDTFSLMTPVKMINILRNVTSIHRKNVNFTIG